jgi:hypothetical protein
MVLAPFESLLESPVSDEEGAGEAVSGTQSFCARAAKSGRQRPRSFTIQERGVSELSRQFLFLWVASGRSEEKEGDRESKEGRRGAGNRADDSLERKALLVQALLVQALLVQALLVQTAVPPIQKMLRKPADGCHGCCNAVWFLLEAMALVWKGQELDRNAPLLESLAACCASASGTFVSFAPRRSSTGGPRG